MILIYLIGEMMLYILAFFIAFWILKFAWILIVAAVCGFAAGWKSVKVQHRFNKKIKQTTKKADK